MRLAGLSAMLTGVCFIIVGFFHPLNIPAAVTTDVWVNVHIFAMLMCFFGIFGLLGLYVRQVEKVGLLGLAGFLMFSVWFTLVFGFSLIEAYILPTMAVEFPIFVEGFLGMFSGEESAIELSIMPTLWNISGPLYILGQLFFGIVTFRAGIFPRYAGALLAFSAIVTPVGALIPPEHQPLVMVPVGLALAWLGYSLWSERKKEVVV